MPAVSVAYSSISDFTYYKPTMPLIWTDDDDAVTRIHNKPSMVTGEDEEEAIYVSNIPPTPDGVSDEEARESMYYTDDLGIHYK